MITSHRTLCIHFSSATCFSHHQVESQKYTWRSMLMWRHPLHS